MSHARPSNVRARKMATVERARVCIDGWRTDGCRVVERRHLMREQSNSRIDVSAQWGLKNRIWQQCRQPNKWSRALVPSTVGGVIKIACARCRGPHHWSNDMWIFGIWYTDTIFVFGIGVWYSGELLHCFTNYWCPASVIWRWRSGVCPLALTSTATATPAVMTKYNIMVISIKHIVMNPWTIDWLKSLD